MSSKKAARLYESFKPSKYILEITLDPEHKKFHGTVSIRGDKTGRPSKRLTFHSKDLKVTKAVLHRVNKKGSNTDGVQIAVDRINIHKSYDEVRLHTTEMLYPGEYHLVMEFSGAITDHMQGLYPCYYTHEGKDRFLLATQFESHHAREVLPCIDEPEAKATFDLAVMMPDDFGTVLSNMPMRSEFTEDKLRTTIFEPTPIMSTYLLAFVAGDMHCVEAKTKDGIVVRSWSSVAQPKSTLQYSVEEGVRILEFFTEYFETPYPLPKCDQVALPDFDAGAMENWGLITYREIALLADADNRSVSNEQYVSMVVAHELSHQWFGNLVTMKWWDDLWLNESFASLMEHIALAAIHPEWQQWEHYVAMDVIGTSNRDIYSDIQPVTVEVTDPELIESLFDPGIVYAKGGRLLKMMRDHIGEDAFRSGLKTYFDRHAYQNATRNDLWKALDATSKQDISSLMDAWLTKPGMPVIKATQHGTELTVTQERFLLDKKDDPSLWPVPLLADKEVEPKLFMSKQADITLKSDTYVLLNAQASGHYFVHYQEPEHRAYLDEAIRTRSIPTESRINILNDMYLLARRGDSSLVDALDAASQCSEEPRDTVWVMISRTVGAASQLTEGSIEAEQQLKALRVRLGKHWYDKLGWDDEADDDSNTKQLRHTALAFMLGGEDAAAIKEALRRYDAADNAQDLPAETRNSILSAAVRHGDAKTADILMTAYPNAAPDLQLDITSALASTKNPEVAKYIFSAALGPAGFVRTQDVLRWIALFMRNRHTREVTWQYMVGAWDWLQSALSASKSFDYLPTYCAGVITTDEWAAKFREFFEPLSSMKSLQRNIAVGYSDIDSRVLWRKRDEQAILNWLNDLKK